MGARIMHLEEGSIGQLSRRPGEVDGENKEGRPSRNPSCVAISGAGSGEREMTPPGQPRLAR